MKNKHPDMEECLEILREYKTPERVIRHCKAVTDAAVKIAAALNDKGFNFDIPLILSAGLLHDIARVHDEHWEVGSDFLITKGFVQEAEIVRKHMTHPLDHDPMKLKELDIVCIGDRVTLEEQYVGIDKRMDYVLSKAAGDKFVESIINKNREINKMLVKNIELIIGVSIEKLILNN